MRIDVAAFKAGFRTPQCSSLGYLTSLSLLCIAKSPRIEQEWE